MCVFVEVKKREGEKRVWENGMYSDRDRGGGGGGGLVSVIKA